MNCSCTVYQTVEYLSKKWALIILHQLSRGDEWQRFSTVRNAMPEITPKILTERLRELESQGLVEKRTDSSTVPIRTEYRLTDAGRDLLPVIRELKMWALKWKIDNPVCLRTNCQFCTL